MTIMSKVCEKPLRGTDKCATGTDAGFQRHWRAKEAPCEPCAKAHSEHVCRNQKINPESHRKANKRWRGNNQDYFADWRDKNPEYGSWKNMIHRCTDPNHVGYERWGGRGISICERWLNSYENFLADMGPKPTPGHSIDRIDNDGNYEPENCKWSTRVEQRANRRDCFVRAAL